jgi:hypothetical protein
MKQMPSLAHQTSMQTKQPAAGYPKRFRKGVACVLISQLGIMLLGGGFQSGQSGGDALFIDKKGRIGIGTTNPEATLEVAGSTKLNGSVGINRAPASDQHLSIQPDKDQIPFNVTDPSGAKKWLTVTGSGNVIMNGGNVGIGTATPEAKLDVAGDARIKGKVTRHARYQRDDETEGFYEISPRYHLSLTGVKYGGRTKTIPQDTLEALCADYDGCEVRLAMTRWASDTNTESASAFFTFYYSAGNGRWRASATDAGNAAGVDGDGKTKHVRNIWSTCFFTDGTYNQYKDLGDKGPGLQLLVWKEFKNKNRTYELTLID